MIRELGESDLFEIWHTFTNVCNCFAYALLDQPPPSLGLAVPEFNSRPATMVQ